MQQKSKEEVQVWDKNHPARKVFDEICWQKFGQTFNDLCENDGNQQSGFWLGLILPAMEAYAAQFTSQSGCVWVRASERLPDHGKKCLKLWGNTYSRGYYNNNGLFITADGDFGINDVEWLDEQPMQGLPGEQDFHVSKDEHIENLEKIIEQLTKDYNYAVDECDKLREQNKLKKFSLLEETETVASGSTTPMQDEAVEFGEWLLKHDEWTQHGYYWLNQKVAGLEQKTTEQLYTIFRNKQESKDYKSHVRIDDKHEFDWRGRLHNELADKGLKFSQRYEIIQWVEKNLLEQESKPLK